MGTFFCQTSVPCGWCAWCQYEAADLELKRALRKVLCTIITVAGVGDVKVLETPERIAAALAMPGGGTP